LIYFWVLFIPMDRRAEFALGVYGGVCGNALSGLIFGNIAYLDNQW